MEWLAILLQFLPMILELFDKAVNGDKDAVALIKTIGGILKESQVPESKVLGIALIAASNNPALMAAQRDAFALKHAEQVEAYAKIKEA